MHCWPSVARASLYLLLLTLGLAWRQWRNIALLFLHETLSSMASPYS